MLLYRTRKREPAIALSNQCNGIKQGRVRHLTAEPLADMSAFRSPEAWAEGRRIGPRGFGTNCRGNFTLLIKTGRAHSSGTLILLSD